MRVLTAVIDSEWLAPRYRLILPEKTVHLWRVPLDVPRDKIDRFAQSLSSDERARAARFHFDLHRDRFVVARGYLREILGRYLATSPDAVAFKYGRHGKPALASPMPVGRRLCFNLSHSGPLALYGFALNAKIGVDVEQLVPRDDIIAVAGRFFSDLERGQLSNAPSDRKLEVFYTTWTRKEAYIKACGTGLGRPLDTFSVSADIDSSNALIELSGDPKAIGHWWVQGITLAEGFVGAYCVEGHDWGLWLLDPHHP